MRFRWFGCGVVAASILIAGGGLWLKSDRRRAELLHRENERLLRQQEALARRAERLARERKQLAEIIERLDVERRVAEVEVLEQHAEADGRVRQTVIRLTEIDRHGHPLEPHTFGVPGSVPHFDALVIKFENAHVAHGDQLRGRSLALFRRVYGETQAPEDGYWLGRRGAIPDVYRTSRNPSDFELSLWRDFWTYALDRAKARQAGIRVAQGEAVYAPMRPGDRWLLTLEADGGLNLVKPDDPLAADSVVIAAPKPFPPLHHP
ncbi:MAG: hypothetical protein GY842_19105 [bacterium]|nr:hypothetical protein [bacterium]